MSATVSKTPQPSPATLSGLPMELHADVPIIAFAQALASAGLTVVQGTAGTLLIIVNPERLLR